MLLNAVSAMFQQIANLLNLYINLRTSTIASVCASVFCSFVSAPHSLAHRVTFHKQGDTHEKTDRGNK